MVNITKTKRNFIGLHTLFAIIVFGNKVGKDDSFYHSSPDLLYSRARRG